MEPLDESGRESPDFTFVDDDGRAKIKQYAKTSKFRPHDKVEVRIPGTETFEGPFIVASVPAVGKYTLVYPNWQTAKDGNVIDEKDLREAQNN